VHQVSPWCAEKMPSEKMQSEKMPLEKMPSEKMPLINGKNATLLLYLFF